MSCFHNKIENILKDEIFLVFLTMQADKYVPMHLRRRKGADHAEARTFEMMPATGCLQPGHRQNVQVKFMPSEQVCIRVQVKVILAPSFTTMIRDNIVTVENFSMVILFGS